MDNQVLPSHLKLPKIAIFAVSVAFFLVLSALAGAIRHIWSLIGLVVPIMAGITILKKRAWGAYGFALFEVTQSLLAPALFLRDSDVTIAQIAVMISPGIALALLFFLLDVLLLLPVRRQDRPYLGLLSL